MKKTILLFADWFEPGYKAGGPIRSCVHFVHEMKDRYDIYVITTDRDLNDTVPYDVVTPNEWITYGEGVKVFYASPEYLKWKNIRELVKTISPDYIYLNSMFSKFFTIYPLLMARMHVINSNMVLAPRGMLKSSALQFKAIKKKIYLNVFHLLKLHRFVHFHATDKTEYTDVQKHFGKAARVTMASNFPGIIKNYPGTVSKNENELSIIFIGRLHPVKNLDFLLKALKTATGRISLTIVGNAEDEVYVNHCKSIIQGYPSNIRVDFLGEIPNHKLPPIIAQHHIFALPTLGENFGHAIFEALAAGKPILISDQTPWRNLALAKAGWDISLQQPEQFAAAVQLAVNFGQHDYDTWSYGAWQFVRAFVKESNLQTAYNNLFT